MYSETRIEHNYALILSRFYSKSTTCISQQESSEEIISIDMPYKEIW